MCVCSICMLHNQATVWINGSEGPIMTPLHHQASVWRVNQKTICLGETKCQFYTWKCPFLLLRLQLQLRYKCIIYIYISQCKPRVDSDMSWSWKGHCLLGIITGHGSHIIHVHEHLPKGQIELHSPYMISQTSYSSLYWYGYHIPLDNSYWQG